MTAKRSITAAAIACALILTTTAAAHGKGGDSPAQIAITDQASDQIAILESDKESWANGELVWTWKPGAGNDLGAFADAWGTPDEAKLRHRGDQAYLLTNDSKGLAAVVPYPQGTPAYWAADVGGPNNPHSIELLPDGNVAVAASTGGWIRIYTASQGPRSTTYVEFPLESGHGVYWDTKRDVLWALGHDHLVALDLGGTAANPTLSEQARIALPTAGGHDLQPVATESDRLWVTTGSQVYQYDIERGKFLQNYPGVERINRPGVKSVGDERHTGQVLTSFPDPDNPCSWCTDTATLSLQNEEYSLDGAEIYKSRWWVDPNRDG